MRHGEPTLNTFNPVLTYLMRCNSDVTSLLSGTALKAVIAYVTDYITKNPLRTHTMFDVIRNVFRRNEEFLTGDATQEDKAHKLIVQITNALTVKQEVGAPMASAYLLGFPDHYTNFTYKPFYWRSYVAEVKGAWREVDGDSLDAGAEDEERVIIRKGKDGKITSYTSTQDYTMRPSKYDSMTLYEWIERYVKKPIRKRKEEPEALRDEVSREDEAHEDNAEDTTEEEDADLDGDDSRDQFSESDEEYEPETDVDDQPEVNTKLKTDKMFLLGHPQRKTHTVSLLDPSKARIPQFIGGLLPREDQGNLEDFYIAMLTLYKPWRNGQDLKDAEESWKEAHEAYEYPARFDVIRKFCNIRYECSDARDDYRQSRKKGGDELFFMHGQFAAEADAAHAESQILGYDDVDLSFDITGPTTDAAFRAEQMKSDMESALKSSGWNRVADEGRTEGEGIELITGEDYSSKEWGHILTRAKEQEINERTAKMEGIDVNAPEISTDYMDVDVMEGVEVMHKSYFGRYCEDASPEDREHMDDTVKKFMLNTEQERAFRLVANHSLLKVKEPLAMHLGGMGGTGKSRVINALIAFFVLVGKSHIFLIVAPTGTAASLIGGQTYHSVLAFNSPGEEGKSGRVNTGPKALKSVRERLKLVECATHWVRWRFPSLVEV
ncbi:unnamed protein product [Peniophora sp. CBMAI 1063]|nr:unnamed protein product [Peniophora sp. CBMAI 1063]